MEVSTVHDLSVYLTPRKVYALLVYHGLKPEVAAPFLDFEIDSKILRSENAVENFPEGFPAEKLTKQVQEIVDRIWTSTEAEIQGSVSALEDLPVCVVTCNAGIEVSRTYVDASGTLQDVVNRAASCQRPQGVVGALVDNRICSLQELVPKSKIRILRVEALSVNSPHGRRIYKRSLKFLLSIAMRRVFPQTTLHCEYALGGGVMCSVDCSTVESDNYSKISRRPTNPEFSIDSTLSLNIRSPVQSQWPLSSGNSPKSSNNKSPFDDTSQSHFDSSARCLELVEAEMHSLCKEGLEFHFVKLSYEDALEYFRMHRQQYTLELLIANFKNALTIPCVECDGCYMIVRNAPTVSNTRLLSPSYLGISRPFRLIAAPSQATGASRQSGAVSSFVLWYMLKREVGVTDDTTDYEHKPTLQQMYDERKAWGKKVRIDIQSVGGINKIIKKGAEDTKELIQIAEAMHDAQIVQIADSIVRNNDIKLVLIAGINGALIINVHFFHMCVVLACKI